ncbi:MAG TPA: glycosyltransferase family 87 protein [Terriglobales bacterium]|nr:glycosyltransferase family 87 protein [Terriglobales bacterium]
MKNRARKWLPWLALAALLTVQGLTLVELRPRILGGEVDFTAFYSAARVVAEGRGADLYKFDTQREFQRDFPARRTPLLFYHPPFELLLFLPLAWLPYVPAYAAWMALNLGVLACLAWLPHPYADVFPRFRGLLPLVLALAFFPITVALMQGQDSILLLCVFTLAWMALRRGQSFHAGCILALGLFKFQFVLPFMVALAVRRKWKALKGFLFTGLGLGLVSLVPVGWPGARSYVEFLLEINQHLAYGTIRPVSMPNLRGLMAALGTGLPVLWLSVTTAILSLCLLALVVRYWPPEEHRAADSLDLAFAVNLIATLLVSYHLNVHDLALLFLAMLLVVRYLVATSGHRRPAGRALLACLLLLFFPPLLMPSDATMPPPVVWVLLVMVGALVSELRAASRLHLSAA